MQYKILVNNYYLLLNAYELIFNLTIFENKGNMYKIISFIFYRVPMLSYSL